MCRKTRTGSVCAFSGKSGAEFVRKEKTGGTARDLEREGSKRRNIVKLVGYNDSGGEMVRKVEFETAQGSAPTISVRWYNWKNINDASGAATVVAAESMGVDGKDIDEESDNHNGKGDNESAENTDGKDDGKPAENADETESNAGPDTEKTCVPPGYLPAVFIFFMTRGSLADSRHRVNVLQLDNYPAALDWHLERTVRRILR